jgi:uncharacterized membrane protein YidH (DUF202 family)
MTPPGTSDATPADDTEEIDPGLARERTSLAWTRTAISFAALGGALLKTTPPVGALVLGTSALVWALGRMTHRSGRPEATRRLQQLMITVTVTLVSAVALTMVLLGEGSPPR